MSLLLVDGWSELERGQDGKIIASKARFPSGIQHVSDYVHSKGVRLKATAFSMSIPADYGGGMQVMCLACLCTWSQSVTIDCTLHLMLIMVASKPAMRLPACLPACGNLCVLLL